MRLFSSILEVVYSVSTLIVIVMIMFPPVYGIYAESSFFRGYEFVFDLNQTSLIDIGRLSLQFIALGIVVLTIRRVAMK